MKNKNERFVTVYKEGSSLSDKGVRRVIVDMETGVNYLTIQSGYGLSCVPLIDKDGRPLVSELPANTNAE